MQAKIEEIEKVIWYYKNIKSTRRCGCSRLNVTKKIITVMGDTLIRCDNCFNNLKLTFNNTEFIESQHPKRELIEQREKHKIELLNMQQDVTCPFCLFQSKVQRFISIDNKGHLAHLASCPDCNNKMRLKTLLNEKTVKEYAKWVFEYRLSGFWKKVPFERFKKRLYEMGISREFWDTYKLLRDGEATDEIWNDKQRLKDDYGIE